MNDYPKSFERIWMRIGRKDIYHLLMPPNINLFFKMNINYSNKKNLEIFLFLMGGG
jgi:hypothetical protein